MEEGRRAAKTVEIKHSQADPRNGLCGGGNVKKPQSNAFYDKSVSDERSERIGRGRSGNLSCEMVSQ